jgi:hypothetical protein
MESTGRGEVVVTWRSRASFDLMIMMLTRLLYLAAVADGVVSLSQRTMVAVKKSGH